MLKNKSKIAIFIIAIILLFSNCCYATSDNTVLDNSVELISTEEDHTESTETSLSNLEYVSDDLYLFGDNIVMDKAVDGNAYLFGKNVEVTGAVNGNLFVFGDVVNFKSGSYAVQSIYVCANRVTFDAECIDLYAVCNSINISNDSIIYRDLRLGCSSLDFSAKIGRNAFIASDNFKFVKDGDEPGFIYGNLSYTGPSELELSTEQVNGTVTYTPITVEEKTESIQEIIVDKLISLASNLIFTLMLYFAIMFITPKFFEKSASYISINTLAAAGIGALALVLIPIICIVLLFIPITIGLSFFILTLYILSIVLSMPIISVCISNKLTKVFKTNKYVSILVLLLSAAVVWGLAQIPVVGVLMGFVYAIVGLGILLLHLFTKNIKEKNNESGIVKE